jgi:hypothetical protein
MRIARGVYICRKSIRSTGATPVQHKYIKVQGGVYAELKLVFCRLLNETFLERVARDLRSLRGWEAATTIFTISATAPPVENA